MPAEFRTDIACRRVAEVHIAHFGLGNRLADDSYERWKRKHISIQGRETDKNYTHLS